MTTLAAIAAHRYTRMEGSVTCVESEQIRSFSATSLYTPFPDNQFPNPSATLLVCWL